MSRNNSLKLNFPLQVLITVLAAAGLSFYPLNEFGDSEIISGSIAGLILSTVNVLLGYAAIEFSFHSSYTHFIQIVLGGIALRMFFILFVLLVLIGIFKFHIVSLITSLFSLYVIFLVLEVFYIHNRWQQKISQNTEVQ
ncbi:MAG: hypothetical protein H3C35_00660 [Bacteroidetes bacterium]|nr:hypothetical protein [Bacteroidota bacterium]